MGLDKFEQQIKDSHEYFEQEPSMEHMDKFLFKLQEQKEAKKTNLISWNKSSWWIGIAASLSLLISIGMFINRNPIPQKQPQQMGLSMELLEIKTYYNNESEKKLEKINQCNHKTANTQKLIENTESQIMKLDFNADKLENKLLVASGNKRVELAFIQNLKAKNDLINKMYVEICSNQNLLTQ